MSEFERPALISANADEINSCYNAVAINAVNKPAHSSRKAEFSAILKTIQRVTGTSISPQINKVQLIRKIG